MELRRKVQAGDIHLGVTSVQIAFKTMTLDKIMLGSSFPQVKGLSQKMDI